MTDKEKVCMFDVDGVLADFVAGFTFRRYAYARQGKILTTLTQETWEDAARHSSDLNAEVYELISKDNYFWQQLNPLVEPHVFQHIDILCDHYRVYFITSRFGVRVKQQTETWLHTRGIKNPTVIVTKDKPGVCHAIGVTHALEDNLETANELGGKGIHSYLIHRKYNAPEPGKVIVRPTVHRVHTVENFIGHFLR